MMKKKTTVNHNKMSKKNANENSHPMLKNKMMMTLIWTELIYLKGLKSFLEFSINMVYVWCKKVLKSVKKRYIEVKRIFENFF